MNAFQKKLLNLFLLGFVGALAAWLLFYTLGRKDERVAEEKEAVRVLPAGMKVVGLELTTPTGRLRMERSKEWRIAEPLATAAEQSTVEGMVEHLLGLEQRREVGRERTDGGVEPPEELWLFALEPPRFTVTLTDEGGDQVTLLVGKKNTFDGSVYVKLADAPSVMQVDGTLEYQVDKNLYQLRDKRLVAFGENQVTRVAVRPEGGESYVVMRAGNDFVVIEPRRMPADRAQVTGMLSALSNVRAKEFVSEQGTAEERRRYGLDLPTVTVELGVGEARHELWLTRQRQGNDLVHYAMRAVDGPILRLSSDWVFKKVNVGLAALRDRRVLRFEREAVRTLKLIRGETRLVFERAAEGGRDRWRMLEPEAGEVDDATLAGILYRLSSLKAKSVLEEEASDQDLANAGLVDPEVAVELNGTGGESLAAARFGPELEGERLAASGRRIDLVEASVISELSFQLGDYRKH